MELVRRAGAIDGAWEALQEDAAALDVYYIPTRYADALPGDIPADAFAEDDATRALGKAERVVLRAQSGTDKLTSE